MSPNPDTTESLISEYFLLSDNRLFVSIYLEFLFSIYLESLFSIYFESLLSTDSLTDLSRRISSFSAKDQGEYMPLPFSSTDYMFF
jgi:hypothetical protein